uniref:Hexosyltransferase n=1 Tax=Bursaphelenchus xylophilus TaxID=6326 RepID=A0A1I7SUQ9_BURXY
MAAAVVPRRTAKVLVCIALSGLVIYLYFSFRSPYSPKYPNFSANFLDREFQYSLDPPDVRFCDQISDNITVVALIITAPANFEKRNDARNTWMYDKGNPADIQVRFIVGRTTNASLEAEIAEEQRKYKDILRYNYLDTYDLLPIKVHAAFNFFQTFCPSVKYFLKIDDDVVADLNRLSYHINNSFDHIKRRDFFACFVWAKPPVIRHKTSRL